MKFQLIIIALLFVACKSPQPNPSTTISLPYEIKTPTNLTNDSPLLILLHGYGSHKKDLASFGSRLNEKLVVVCPQAPNQVGNNRFAWYPLNLTAEKRYQFEDVKKVKGEIIQFIKEIRSKYGLNNSKVFVGGFSQGAIMSMYLGLTEHEQIDGIIALSGHLYPEVRNEIKYNSNLKNLKFFMSHGKQDNVLDFKTAEEGYNYLNNRAIHVDKFWYNSKHQITGENLRDMRSWLDKQL